eukprot:EG_transcript_20842
MGDPSQGSTSPPPPPPPPSASPGGTGGPVGAATRTFPSPEAVTSSVEAEVRACTELDDLFARGLLRCPAPAVTALLPATAPVPQPPLVAAGISCRFARLAPMAAEAVASYLLHDADVAAESLGALHTYVFHQISHAFQG